MSKTSMLAAEWQRYITLVAPNGVPDVQFVEMRRSFYAGAQGLLRMQLEQASDEASDEVIAFIDTIQAELTEFAADVTSGKA